MLLMQGLGMKVAGSVALQGCTAPKLHSPPCLIAIMIIIVH